MERIDNKTRLAVLKRVLEDTRSDDWYICYTIRYELERRGILPHGYFTPSCTDRVVSLFPELLKYKPKGVAMHGIYGWFGRVATGAGTIRVKVLESLIAEIAAQTEEEAI
jgi:hypothetical protein